MNIGKAAKICFTKYAKFAGRASRSEYWNFVLFNFMVSIAISVFFGDQDAVNLYTLAIFIPSIAAGTRRLHDTGRSGWYQLLCLIPLVGIFIVIFFLAKKCDQEKNRFGPNPLESSPASARSNASTIDDAVDQEDVVATRKNDELHAPKMRSANNPGDSSGKNSNWEQTAPTSIKPSAEPQKPSKQRIPTAAERTSTKSTPRFGRDAAKKGD
jgi:uncharacterized membrane protein YhaH (DUF805 family)